MPRAVFQDSTIVRRGRRLTGGWVVVFSCLAAWGCRCETHPEPPTETAPSKAPPDERCRPKAENKRFTIAPLIASTAAVVDQRPAPFSVEVGRAAVVNSGFAVSFVQSDGSRSKAGLALMDQDAGAGQILSLGTVHGDAAPPLLSADASGLVIVVPDNDAAGGMLRVAGLSPANEVVFGGEIDLGVDDSPAFDVALGQTHAIAVWDEWDKPNNQSYVASSVFLRDQLSEVGVPVRLSSVGVDAHSPRVLPKRDGFWLAWVSVGAKVRADAPNQPVSVSSSWIEIVSLDAQGALSSTPVLVTPKAGTVAGFDIAAGHPGSALVTWRDAKTTPGISGGTVFIASVQADGSVDAQLVEDQNVGAGIPQFLFDGAPSSGAPHGWLSLDGADGSTRFTGLSPFGVPLELLETDKTVGLGSLLLAHRGHLLLASPQGQSVSTRLIRCGDGTPLPRPEEGAPERTK